MMGERIFKAAALVALVGMFVAAPMAHAAQADSGDDDDDTGAQLAQDIGCVATYDVILAAGKGRIKAQESIRHARDVALDAFREDSDLSEAEVRADVVQADRMLPQLLKQANQSLAEFKAGCDAAFMANPFADSDAQPL